MQIYVDEVGCHTVRSKEAIVDALQERVGIYRFSEIVKVVSSVNSLWRSRKTYLGGAVKIFQYLSPSGIILCTSSMALVNNYKVEEVLLHLKEWIGLAFLAYKLMI